MLTYSVQSGDTLTSIAAQFGVTLAALEAANPQISNPNMIEDCLAHFFGKETQQIGRWPGTKKMSARAE